MRLLEGWITVFMNKNKKKKSPNNNKYIDNEYELDINVNTDSENIYSNESVKRKDIFVFAFILIGISIVLSTFAVLYQKLSIDGTRIISAYGDIGDTISKGDTFKLYSNVVAKSLPGGMWELQINGTIIENTVSDINFGTGISLDKINKLLNLNLYDDNYNDRSKNIVHSIITENGKNIKEVKNDAFGISSTLVLNSDNGMFVFARFYSEDNDIGPWDTDMIVYREGNTIDATLFLKEK